MQIGCLGDKVRDGLRVTLTLSIGSLQYGPIPSMRLFPRANE